MQLHNLGLSDKLVSITSKMKAEDRTEAVRQFNDPKSAVKILVTTDKLGGQSLNLQEGGCHLACMDLFGAYHTYVQVGGRIDRIGQDEETIVLIPWLRNSYDQYMWHRVFVKGVPALAGEGAKVFHNNPTIDAEEKLRYIFGLKYSALDPVWHQPKWSKVDDWRAWVDLTREAKVPLSENTEIPSSSKKRKRNMEYHPDGVNRGNRLEGKLYPTICRKS
jgi:helicase-like protein